MQQQQQDNKTKNNSAAVFGVIESPLLFSHETYGEGFYTFLIKAARLSDAADILPITVSERIIEKEMFIKGAYLRVTGQLRSHNSPGGEGKSHLIITLFAADISFAKPDDYLKQNPNEVFLNGFVCKPPVYRVTPLGREIADLLVAVNRSYDKSDYIPVISWGRNARFAGKLEVGCRIMIWGRLQSRVYQKIAQDGTTYEKTAYEVSVTKITRCGDEAPSIEREVL